MFPWLFPYGLGGISQPSLKHKLSEIDYKYCLLLYYDKWFQYDQGGVAIRIADQHLVS